MSLQIIQQGTNATDDSTTSQPTTSNYPAGTYLQRVGAVNQNRDTATGAASVASPNIEFISRTVNTLNGIPTAGFTAFTFHNAVNDALQSGALQGINLTNVNSLLTTLPSDWKAKFTTSPDAMSDLLNQANELMGLAHDLWTQPPTAADSKSQWFDGTQSYMPTNANWNAQRNLYQQSNSASVASNAGTYKDGLADHPDYHGPVGFQPSINTYYDVATESVGSAVELATGIGAFETTALGTAIATAVPGAAEVALALGSLAIGGYALYKMAGGSANIKGADDMINWVQGQSGFGDIFSDSNSGGPASTNANQSDSGVLGTLKSAIGDSIEATEQTLSDDVNTAVSWFGGL
jgi:hypothetical protein